MLVLSRKQGQQIVLPHCGVTIGVVAVQGKHVRLGIVAPSEIPVHRGEVWSRIRRSAGGDHARHLSESSSVSPDLEGSPRVSSPAANAPDAAWHYEIRRRIAARTHGHVLDIELEAIDGRLIVHGRARSYYGKQLACAAVLELMETLDPDAASQFELDIRVPEN